MSKKTHIPDHWDQADWEQKAQENPLHAIMTVTEYRDKALDDLSDGAPEEFLEKGRQIFTQMVLPYLSEEEKNQRLVMFDYGCGAGRIMNAVIEAGHDVLGADISPTMIETCGKIVPGAKARLVVGSDGVVHAPDESCDVAYSFAVVQHIKSLSTHDKAIQEMARVIKPGGLLSIQVNCEDYEVGTDNSPGYTVNFEEFSVHYVDPETGPVRAHEQNNWSGVYIGADRLVRQLNGLGFHVVKVFNWNPKKRRAMVFVARKQDGKNDFEPRPDPFASPNVAMYRALMKRYARAAMERAAFKKELKALREKDQTA